MCDTNRYAAYITEITEKGYDNQVKYLQKLISKYGDIISSFCIMPFTSNSPAPALNNRIITNLNKSYSRPVQIYIHDIDTLKDLIDINPKEYTVWETLRCSQSKLYFDIDCHDEHEINEVNAAFNFVIKCSQEFDLPIGGLVEYSTDSDEINQIMEHFINSNEHNIILKKYNPKKDKLLSCHVVLLGAKFYRTEISETLFKGFRTSSFKNFSPFKTVLDGTVYKQNGKQQPMRIPIFIKPGKQEQLVEYTEEEIEFVKNNIDAFVCHSINPDDKLITLADDSMKRINQYIQEILIEPTYTQATKPSEKSSIENNLKNRLFNEPVHRIHEFTGHADWIKKLTHQIQEYILTNEIEETEENKKELLKIFTQEEYQYFSNSRNKKICQPSSVNSAIRYAFTHQIQIQQNTPTNQDDDDDFTEKLILNGHDLKVDYTTFKSYRNKTIPYKSFAYIFNNTFAFFNKYDCEQMVYVKQNDEFIRIPIKELINAPDALNFVITIDVKVKVKDETQIQVKALDLTFKSILKIFEKYKNKFYDCSICSNNAETFSFYNLSTVPKFIPDSLDDSVHTVLCILCNNDENRINFVLDWMAYMLQYPQDRNHTALEFVGYQGTGKNLITNMLCDYLKSFSYRDCKIDYFSANFNNLLCDKKLVICNECPKGEKELGCIKSFITDPIIEIKTKNISNRECENKANLIVLSNYFDTDTIEDNDRRFNFFYSPLKPESKEFYEEFCRNKDEIKDNFINFLLARDLSNYNPNKQYDDDDRKMLLEKRLNERSPIYHLIVELFKQNPKIKSFTINEIQAIADMIINEEIKPFDSDDDDFVQPDFKINELNTLKEKQLKQVKHAMKDINISKNIYNSIWNAQPLPVISQKLISNILNFEKTSDYYLSGYTIKLRIRDFKDVYDYIDQHKEVSLNELKEEFKGLIHDNNYVNALRGKYQIVKTRIDNCRNTIIKTFENQPSLLDVIPEEGITLKELKIKIPTLTDRNYTKIIKELNEQQLDYEITVKRCQRKGMNCKLITKTLKQKTDIDSVDLDDF